MKLLSCLTMVNKEDNRVVKAVISLPSRSERKAGRALLTFTYYIVLFI